MNGKCIMCGESLSEGEFHNVYDCYEYAEHLKNELVKALQSLVNCLPQSELEIMRECIGNTNTAVIGHWVTNAKNVLAKLDEV